jgi:hypothetical protein
MIARLDALVVAMSVLGGSMLIENSHRVDTGAPDEGLVATPPALCRDEPARYGVSREIPARSIAGESDEDAGADNLPVCSND